MMKIGVISDTHLREPHLDFKKMIEFHFNDVEKIFHAGDFVDWRIADYLSSQKELIAVCGNMDSQDIQKVFPRKRAIEVEGFKIGLIHGGGPPFGIESRIREEFDEVDAIVYGHSRNPTTLTPRISTSSTPVHPRAPLLTAPALESSILERK
jgi:putative phosphoesterase